MRLGEYCLSRTESVGLTILLMLKVLAWLNYIIFNQTEGPSINCQIDNFASLTPSGTSAYQQDVRLTDQSPSSSSTNQSSLTGME